MACTLVLYVDLRCCECSKKIKKVINKLKEQESIEKVSYDEKNGTVTLTGPFDPSALARKLKCKACRVITSVKIFLPQGPKGDKGETGPQGPKGDRGPPGQTGLQGVVVAVLPCGCRQGHCTCREREPEVFRPLPLPACWCSHGHCSCGRGGGQWNCPPACPPNCQFMVVDDSPPCAIM